MKEGQKHTPKYWIAHDPEDGDVYLDTADKSYDGCIKKTLKLYFNDEVKLFYSHIDEGKLKVELMEIRDLHSPESKPLEPTDFEKIVPKPYLRLEAIEDFKMKYDEEIAFKKGKSYLFAHVGKDTYITVSENDNDKHYMYEEDLQKYFKLLK